MADFVPYTYLIGWSKHDLWYYGVQYNKRAHPKNLWTTYFTSSKLVAKAILDYGEPDIVEVRKTFRDKDNARLWEHKVLQRIGARKSDRWLNQTDNLHHYSRSPKSPWNKGKTLSTEQKQKIRNSLKGRTLSDEHRKKMSDAHRARDKTVSEETREKMSAAKTGKNVSSETKEKMRAAKLGIKKDQVKCPYCDKFVAPHLFNRWHNKKCKYFALIASNHDK